MKFRRGIAKLLVAVTIVELVLSSINRSEYVVLAATDETTQSELVAETESQDEAERTLADTMGVIAENIDEEDVQSLSEATTEAGVLEETESDEEGTESSESDTTSDEGETENGEAGTEKDVTEETTENTEEGTTEESNENTESSVGDTTESSKGDATENTESTITEETTTEGNSEKSTEDTTEDRSSETSGATKEETGTSSEDTTETKDSSGKVSEKDTQNSIMDTVREAIEEMDNAEPQAVGEIDLGNPTVPATKAEL
ncbi:MAG: hypothetical protein J6B26_02395, partial [Agathobacter sp.]|nr:hypothetical protein [Agathobacter sp.]